MLPLTRMRHSRDSWRKKAVERAEALREMRKRCRRLEEKIALLEAPAPAPLPMAPTPAPIVPLVPTQTQRVLCVLLVLTAVMSFRSVPRALEILAAHMTLGLEPPHFTSIINWTQRVGLAKLRAVTASVEPWVAVLDLSIDVGVKKVLVVLRVPVRALEVCHGALTLEACECIGCVVRDSWNGEDVATVLKETFAKAGVPKAILCDGGGDLRRGVRLWKADAKQGRVVVLEDVGHVAACALKSRFSRLQGFIKAMSAIATAAKKLGQSDIAFLTPPRLRTKGRFLGITKLAAWARKILDLAPGSGPRESGSLAHRLRKLLPRFGLHRPFLETFCRTCSVVEEFLAHFKNKGMNQENAATGRAILDRLPERCAVRDRLARWLDRTLAAHCRLSIGQVSLCVSSDALECLFGKFKVIIQRNPKADFTQNVLIIPALCGKLDEASVDRALRDVTHTDLMNWKAGLSPSQMQRRRAFFAGGRVPKPGKARPP